MVNIRFIQLNRSLFRIIRKEFVYLTYRFIYVEYDFQRLYDFSGISSGSIVW